MKFFDLSLPKSIDEPNPKVHKIDFDTFRKAYQDFPRDLAESLVEKGFGKWAPCDVKGIITTPQAVMAPMELFFIALKTNAVKAIHINALVPDNGPAPTDLSIYGANLIKNMRFAHDPEDEYDAEEYDESLEENEVDVTTEEIEEAVKLEVEEANAAALTELTEKAAKLLEEKLALEAKVEALEKAAKEKKAAAKPKEVEVKK